MLNPEHRLIPFETSELPPGPWLVFAPHADDETYGMAGSLLKANEAGIQTHLVVMTDGALGGDTENLVDVREREVHQAAKILGINSVDSWQQPDRGLTVSAELVDRVCAKVREVGAASVFFPGPLELHPDHRITALLTWAAIQKLANGASTPNAYSYEIGVQNPVNLFIDITIQRARKEQAMAVYASQNDENNYEELVLSLDKGRTFTLPAEVSHAEGFYLYSKEELTTSLKDVMHSIIDLYL
ncbi:MAG: PIG-L family deacetylase [Gammaproteobacteria bacterium]|nr:PIG-L family deacetylase [Gammaproteobacteria bacterium]